MANKISQLKTEIVAHDFLTKPRASVLLLPVFENEWPDEINTIDKLVRKKLSEKAKNTHFKAKKGDCLIFSDASFVYQEVVIFGLGQRKEFHLSFLQRYFADVLRGVASRKFSSVAVLVTEILGGSIFELGKFLSEAYYLSQYHFDQYKSKEEKKKINIVGELNIYFDKSKIQNPNIKSNPKSQIPNLKQSIEEFKKGLEFGKIVAQGVYLVRDLVNEPASHAHPATLVKVAREIAADSQGFIEVEVLDAGACRKLGMGAFLGVAQGSNHKPQFIIIKSEKFSAKRDPALREKVKSQNEVRKKICLIGKSITFDSGGLSLKPAEAMETMKIDMSGGATVLGFFQALSHLERRGLLTTNYGFRIGSFDLYGILPACENMPSGKAMRPGDVVIALNGKTIEVANTDAEGRLALADALSYAEKYLHPDYIIDLATLTGAIMVSLGDEITGLFGNQADFNHHILRSARIEGEEIWEMPLFTDYLSKMKSEVADIKNVANGRYGGAITAALFLKEFVSVKTNWVHLDIAGASYNENQAKGIVSKGGTGWGVKTFLRLLCQMSI